jgi:hypothetical protein
LFLFVEESLCGRELFPIATWCLFETFGERDRTKRIVAYIPDFLARNAETLAGLNMARDGLHCVLYVAGRIFVIASQVIPGLVIVCRPRVIPFAIAEASKGKADPSTHHNL